MTADLAQLRDGGEHFDLAHGALMDGVEGGGLESAE